MKPLVAVIAPGMMGAAVGKRLVDNGLKVLTSLKGRSAATSARAKAAGMVSASDEEIAAADFILSILPPGDAVALAQRFGGPLTASNSKPVYVDCNAVAPRTAERIGAAIGPTGAPFVDAGIIGAPPKANDLGRGDAARRNPRRHSGRAVRGAPRQSAADIGLAQAQLGADAAQSLPLGCGNARDRRFRRRRPLRTRALSRGRAFL